MDLLLKIPHKATKRARELNVLYGRKEYAKCVSYFVSCIPLVVLIVSVFSVPLAGVRKLQVLVFVFAQLMGKKLNNALKEWFAQPRPRAALSNRHGMPSYHAQACFFAAVSARGFNFSSRAQTVAILVAFWIAYTRLHLQKHTMAQVVVGSIVGTVLGFVFLMLPFHY